MKMARRRGKIWEFLGMLGLDPVAYPVLIILTIVLAFNVMPIWLSYESMARNVEAKTTWVVLPLSLASVIVLQYLSSRDVRSPRLSFMRRSGGWFCRTLKRIFLSEGWSPVVVFGLIVFVLVMAKFQPGTMIIGLL